MADIIRLPRDGNEAHEIHVGKFRNGGLEKLVNKRLGFYHRKYGKGLSLEGYKVNLYRDVIEYYYIFVAGKGALIGDAFNRGLYLETKYSDLVNDGNGTNPNKQFESQLEKVNAPVNFQSEAITRYKEVRAQERRNTSEKQKQVTAGSLLKAFLGIFG